MTGGKGGKRSVWVGVELDEYKIPNFDALGRAHVDKGAASVAFGREIHMEFRAGPARTRVTHHPKVVFLVAVDDVLVGIQASRAEFLRPDVPCFRVARGGVAFRWIVDRRVKAICWKLPSFDNQFPRPLDGFLFEVISERPVPEHFKKGVVVSV